MRFISSAYLSLGSNMGDTVQILHKAVQRIQKTDGVSVVALSPRYKTKPVGKTDQAWFLNQMIHIRTQLDPYELLHACQTIEDALGRVRKERWGPRTIDIDIIHYEDVEKCDLKLTLPHPRFHQRAFVLVPLADIAPDLIISGKTVLEYVNALPAIERENVILFEG